MGSGLGGNRVSMGSNRRPPAPFGHKLGIRKFVVLLAIGSLALSGCTIRPNALTGDERQAEAERDLARMYGEQPPLLRPLTLREAFERAVLYNLDGRVKGVEEALARDDFDLSRYDLLPKAYLNGAYTDRNNVNGSSSQSVNPPFNQTLIPSTSTDQIDRSADLLVSWNSARFRRQLFRGAPAGRSCPDRRRRAAQSAPDPVPGCAPRLLACSQRTAPERADPNRHQSRRRRAAGCAQGGERRTAFAGRFIALPEGAARSHPPARKHRVRFSRSPRPSSRS